MRHFIFIAVSAFALCACETMPSAFAQSGMGSTTATSATSSTTNAAPAAFTPPPEQQLLELERQLSATAQTEGLGGALAPVMATNGMVIRPGVTLSGAEDITRGLAPPAGAGPIYWQPDRVEVSNSGDMGMTSGRYVQVITGAEAQQGRYVVVWRRDGSGDWKVLTETRIPDPARSQAAAARRR
ncbi:MAG: nuclear transport factor 2 family protein [Hyphomonadaceae bacterium]|nr:nuclear transport factor 2 family protein [Hyphomonadaceae bacterium]